MVSAVAASSFARSIVQRTSLSSNRLHEESSRHQYVSRSSQPARSRLHCSSSGSSLRSKRTFSQAEKLSVSSLKAGASFVQWRANPLTALVPPQASRRVKGSRGSTVCSAAGVGAAEPSGQSAAETDQPKDTLVSKARAVLFFLVTLVLAVPLFVVMLVIYPFQLLFDRYRRRGLHTVNNLWANATTALFYKIDVIGAENLPRKDSPAVYVANHQSYLDIYSLFRLWVPFKFISKTSNFLLPIVGWSMFLTGHIPIKRMDARSQAKCLKACREMLSKGGPLLFFPEGTRSKDQKLSNFKKGAFSVAVKQNVPIVPIALVGTGKLMASGKESSLHSGGVKIIVHPPLSGTDADKLMKETQDVIHKTLVEYGAE